MGALTFGAATLDRVNCGSAAAIDNLGVLTVLALVYPTTFTDGRVIASKERVASNAGWSLRLDGTGGNLAWRWQRATTDMLYQTNTNPLTLNAWNVVVCVANQTGPSITIYVALLGSLLAACGFATTTNGSGAFQADASFNLFWGNTDAATPAAAFQGRIAMAALFGVALSQADSDAWWQHYRTTIGSNTALGSWRLGDALYGTGTQTDETGNGHNGTVTGATQSTGPTVYFPGIVGAFALVGNAAGLRASRRLTAATGAFAFTGNAAGLRAARRFSCSPGSYALTGAAVGLRVARRIAASTGAFTLTGTAVGLRAARRLVAARGAFTLTGNTTGLRAARRLAVGTGVFVFTGNTAGMTVGVPLVPLRISYPASDSRVHASTGVTRTAAPSSDSRSRAASSTSRTKVPASGSRTLTTDGEP